MTKELKPTRQGKGYFTCYLCKETFNKGWSDAEADRESLEIFGVTRFDTPCELVCDDCFEVIRPDKRTSDISMTDAEWAALHEGEES